MNHLKYIPIRANHLNKPVDTSKDTIIRRTGRQPCYSFNALSDKIDPHEQSNDLLQQERDGGPENANEEQQVNEF